MTESMTEYKQTSGKVVVGPKQRVQLSIKNRIDRIRLGAPQLSAEVAGSFVIEDFKVGSNSRLFDSKSIPGEIFAENLGSLNWGLVRLGELVTLHARSLVDEPRELQFTIRGQQIETEHDGEATRGLLVLEPTVLGEYEGKMPVTGRLERLVVPARLAKHFQVLGIDVVAQPEDLVIGRAQDVLEGGRFSMVRTVEHPMYAESTNRDQVIRGDVVRLRVKKRHNILFESDKSGNAVPDNVEFGATVIVFFTALDSES